MLRPYRSHVPAAGPSLVGTLAACGMTSTSVDVPLREFSGAPGIAAARAGIVIGVHGAFSRGD
jgi:hypothetical protein